MSNTRGEMAIQNEQPQEVVVSTSLLKDFLALVKIGIVNSNLITTFTGIWLALYFSGNSLLLNIDRVIFALLGTGFIIAGSCAINNFYDRDIDQIMERTKSRPTVTGRMTPVQVLALGFSFILIGTIFLAMTSITSAIIGLIGVFTYIVLYTMWTKRHYTINTVVGSISGAVPPLIGWTAITDLTIIAWVLFLIMFIWQPPHFLALAMKRSEEYRNAGIPMLPVIHGFGMTKRQMMVWVACLLPLPFYLYSLGFGFIILATILNIGWLILSLSGLKAKDDLKWAKWMFVYSLNYLTILFVAMVVFTIQ
ncbi:protoheme IX farnesyltransferase [Bacillus alveayuensis]|uniref:Protoheme IX farnesyltransferase n=2 Tax=Aeribacillus alveayuensis TaxID=279215 RepID=A0ABT9VKW2_9BACI|nr:protoheme IX farnesyltransferase [Bacillus alveayuensis]